MRNAYFRFYDIPVTNVADNSPDIIEGTYWVTVDDEGQVLIGNKDGNKTFSVPLDVWEKLKHNNGVMLDEKSGGASVPPP